MIEECPESRPSGDDEFPPHEQRTHLLRQLVAEVADNRNPLDVWNLWKQPRRLGRYRQEIEQKIARDLEAEIDLCRLELPLRFQAIQKVQIADGSVLVFHPGKGFRERVPRFGVEKPFVVADGQDSAGNDQTARLVDGFPEIRKEKDGGRVENAVEGFVEIVGESLGVAAYKVDPGNPPASLPRLDKH